MTEATSTLSTERPTGTWRKPLTTIELHRMATTNLAMNPTSLSLRVVRLDVASLLLYVRPIDLTQTL
jgi:hypothetical protein